MKENPYYCGLNELVNSYDNSIFYTDYFISRVIDILKERDENSLVMYTSDHGEGLGEKRVYGHVQNEDVRGRMTVPWFVWVSENYKKGKPQKIRNPSGKSQKKKTQNKP